MWETKSSGRQGETLRCVQKKEIRAFRAGTRGSFRRAPELLSQTTVPFFRLSTVVHRCLWSRFWPWGPFPTLSYRQSSVDRWKPWTCRADDLHGGLCPTCSRKDECHLASASSIELSSLSLTTLYSPLLEYTMQTTLPALCLTGRASAQEWKRHRGR